MAPSAEVSRENGKKGGRPRGLNAINAEKGKQILIEAYLQNIRPINEALISKAREGDIAAIKELHDRVYGKPNQAVDVTSKGQQVGLATPEALALAKEYEEKLKKTL